jgi:DNA invertase Pin-like site-specific DNA recombinase
MAGKAVSYLRVSGKGQIDGDGFPRQRQAVQAFAKGKYQIVGEFRDEGVKGANDLEHREGLSDLMVRVKANGVNVVIVEKADRLARDLMAQEVLLAEFRKAGVTVLTSEGVDLTVADGDPTRKLIRQVLGAVAEFEKSSLVIKLRAARQRMRRDTGRCEGRKPYGYYEGEGKVIKHMKELYRKPRGGKRLTCGKIASKLNEEGYTTRSGGKWHDAQVRRILVEGKVA